MGVGGFPAPTQVEEKRMAATAKLPAKASALIDVAIDDLEASEKAAGVEISMGDWHTCRTVEDAEGLVSIG